MFVIFCTLQILSPIMVQKMVCITTTGKGLNIDIDMKGFAKNFK